MSKFKVGDKVRYCNPVCYWEGIRLDAPNEASLVLGNIYTVIGLRGDSDLELENIISSYCVARFELVEEPKINPLVETVTRTITRTIKEKVTEQALKSGNYGQIYIAGDETVYYCNVHSGKMNRVTTDGLDETIDALIAVRDHWRAVGKIK